MTILGGLLSGECFKTYAEKCGAALTVIPEAIYGGRRER